MADDPDALWKPGNGRAEDFERGEPARFEFRDLPPPAKAGRRFTRRSGSVVGGVVVALVALIGVVVITTDTGLSPRSATESAPTITVAPQPVILPAPERSIIDDERAALLEDEGGDVALAAGDAPISMESSVCLWERLPETVPLRWSVNLDAVAIDGVVHVSDDVVIVPAVVETGFRSRTATVLVGLDINGGDEVWRTAVTGQAASIVGVVDDVIVGNVWFIGAERSRQLAGWSTRTGEMLWSFELGAADRTVVEPEVGLLGLERFDLVLDEVTGRDFAFPAFVVLDPTTGEVVGSRPGRFDSVGPDATFMTRDAVDATFGNLRDTPPSSSLTFSTARVADAPAALVGETVIRTDSDRGTMQRWLPQSASGPQVRDLAITGSVGIDPPAEIDQLVGLDVSSVAIAGDGSVHGANVGENVVEIRWRVDGALVGAEPSDRGRTLVVRRDGGRLQRIVDSSTGRTILDVASVGNEISSSDLFANGVIVRSGTGSSSTRRAVNLDGRTMWELGGAGRLAVGDRVLVDWGQVVDDAGDEAIRVTAFGAPTTGPPSCTRATDSFQGDSR